MEHPVQIVGRKVWKDSTIFGYETIIREQVHLLEVVASEI